MRDNDKVNKEMNKLFDLLIHRGLSDEEYVSITSIMDEMGVKYSIDGIRPINGLLKKPDYISDGYDCE